jgi:hypothetical protein
VTRTLRDYLMMFRSLVGLKPSVRDGAPTGVASLKAQR